jgi:hypothetical protein
MGHGTRFDTFPDLSMSQSPKSMAPTFPLSIVNLLGDPLRCGL